MFIESLEFTIPVDLCSLCSTLQKGSLSDLEFPASVNSYGTTQDASIQVVLRANKLTFKVDGVSSNASIISKSECKTLKLSVFDVDRSLIPQENINFSSNNVISEQHSTPVSNTSKRTYEQTNSQTPVPVKIRKNSHDSNRRKNRSPNTNRDSDSHTNQSKKSSSIIVKTEPEDPDLIEIEPDPEQIKTEDIQTDSSLHVYQTSQLSTSSSFERNVPHVPDFAEPSTSHQHGNQTADDFLVFQDDNYDGEDNEADYSNDGYQDGSGHYQDDSFRSQSLYGQHGQRDFQALPALFRTLDSSDSYSGRRSSRSYDCEHCGKTFTRPQNMQIHMESVHGNMTYACICGKIYKHPRALQRHRKTCALSQT